MNDRAEPQYKGHMRVCEDVLSFLFVQIVYSNIICWQYEFCAENSHLDLNHTPMVS